MAKREIELSLVVCHEDAQCDSDYTETWGTLELDTGEVALKDEDAAYESDNIEEEFTLRGESYSILTDAETGERKISDESLEKIKDAYGLGCGYQFTVQGSHDPMDLLRLGKDTFYEAVESQFNASLESGSIDIRDMELSFESIQENGEATIIAELTEFTISMD